ncbi:MAG: hypothetical protein HFJ03_06560 [Lachnospira sp.]|nr:hypothetical protein [Lachnospira sp.]
MFEQDYIMRLIKEMVRMILKILFNIDISSPTAELLSETWEQEYLESLLTLVDNGNINEAENKIYELTSNKNMENLKIALLFYSYLNDKTDDFLEKNNFNLIKEVPTSMLQRHKWGWGLACFSGSISSH